MTPASLFPARSWPGFKSWFFTVLACTAVFEFIAAFAWKNEQGRLPDFTAAAVAIPAGAVLLVVLAAFLWSWLGRAPFLGALGWSARLLPFAWAVPLFDLIRTYGNGLVIGPPRLSGTGLILSCLTAGMFPVESGISVGIRLGLFTAVIGTGMVMWLLTGKVWKTAAGAAVWSAVAIKLLGVVSLLSLWKSPFSIHAWTAAPVEIPRRALSVMSKGYWWNNLYERFPAAIDAQANVAARLNESGFAVLSLGIILAAAFVILFKKRRSMLAHVLGSWGAFDLALYAALGAAFAFSRGSGPVCWTACLPAIGIFFLLLISLRFSMVLRRDVFRLQADERDHMSQPVLRGDISAQGASELALAGEIYALAAAWVLGWPIFACALAVLSASFLTRGRAWSVHARIASAFRAAGAGAVALMAWFFIAQDARVTSVALAAAVIAALHRIFIEFFWMPKTGAKVRA
jgi:hypothetical protein